MSSVRFSAIVALAWLSHPSLPIAWAIEPPVAPLLVAPALPPPTVAPVVPPVVPAPPPPAVAPVVPPVAPVVPAAPPGAPARQPATEPLSKEAEKQKERSAAANLDSFRLMSFGLAPGVGLAVQFPMAYMEDRRQGEASLGGISYISFHPFYWRSERSVLRTYCARSWVGASFKEVQDQADSAAQEIAEKRMTTIEPMLDSIIPTCKANILSSTGGTIADAACEKLVAAIESEFYRQPENKDGHIVLFQAVRGCADNADLKSCIKQKLSVAIQHQVWDPGVPPKCGSSMPGFYFGISFPYTTQILSPTGNPQRNVNTGFSTGFSLAPSAYLSLLFGITYSNYDETPSDENSKQRHNQITGTFAIGGNIDIITKLLGK